MNKGDVVFPYVIKRYKLILFVGMPLCGHPFLLPSAEIISIKRLKTLIKNRVVSQGCSFFSLLMCSNEAIKRHLIINNKITKNKRLIYLMEKGSHNITLIGKNVFCLYRQSLNGSIK